MRIIIDAMSGDKAPDETLRGALNALKKCKDTFILVGDEKRIHSVFSENEADQSRIETVHADSVINMEDDPITAIHKKKNSSMLVGLELLADGYGDAFVSAGNTGALFAGATVKVKRAKGVKRAAIGTLLPGTDPCLLLDAGASVSVTPEYLEQFAMIGSSYMNKMHGIAAPTVGLLNNGTEDCKGTALHIEANKLLRSNSFINYIGNVEASGVLFGACSVVVCDGFSGNIFLKSLEGTGLRILKALKEIYTKDTVTKLSYAMVKKDFTAMRKAFDPAEYGGSPILGIAKPVIKAHGSSDAFSFENAIMQAIKYVNSSVTAGISEF